MIRRTFSADKFLKIVCRSSFWSFFKLFWMNSDLSCFKSRIIFLNCVTSLFNALIWWRKEFVCFCSVWRSILNFSFNSIWMEKNHSLSLFGDRFLLTRPRRSSRSWAFCFFNSCNSCSVYEKTEIFNRSTNFYFNHFFNCVSKRIDEKIDFFLSFTCRLNKFFHFVQFHLNRRGFVF